MRVVKCYDAVTGRYVDVEVSEEVEVYIKRSYWREDMQERRFRQRRQSYNDMVEYFEISDPVLDDIIRGLEIISIREQINKLDERSKAIVFYRYYREYTIAKIAKQLGISNSYVTKLLKKIHENIRTGYEGEIREKF